MLHDDAELNQIIQTHKKTEHFNKQTIQILEMIAVGAPTNDIYDAIALLYESRHSGLRCSMLELDNGKLLHGGAPSLPKEYCQAVHGLEYGPEIGSCGTATYTGKRCVVENIETDPKWQQFKQFALPHGLRCCWSEPIINSHGKVLGAFGMYYNHPAKPNEEESQDLISAARLAGLVMERDHNQKQIRELAYIDTLTKLASRAYFYQYLEGLISSSKRYKRKFSLLYIDLDDFKSINDARGHDVGDTLLKLISGRLSTTCRDVDFIARLSGDEFCVVTESEGSIDDIVNLAQRCMDTISHPIFIEKIKHTVTCSIGIAHFPNDGVRISTLLKAADTALYSAKDQGKNCYSFYEVELTKRVEYKVHFEQQLREAINRNQMTLVYQPKVDIMFNKVTGVEALSRWHHPNLGIISPDEFINVAERIGLIKSMTEWVLYTACQKAAEWRRTKGHSLRMSVNITPSLFLNKDIIELVKQVISDTGIDPAMLELEVTENVVQTDYKNLSVFDELKALGVHLAIDDFGVGYSSFASLKHIKIDCLKIDKYFISDMLKDINSKYLISSMIDIGHNFGYEIVAEGVETQEQLTTLREMDCNTVQGYLFSKPLEESQLLKWLDLYEKKLSTTNLAKQVKNANFRLQ